MGRDGGAVLSALHPSLAATVRLPQTHVAERGSRRRTGQERRGSRWGIYASHGALVPQVGPPGWPVHVSSHPSRAPCFPRVWGP